MESMFIYTVTWYDCDGAGYAESGVEYKGGSRTAALAAKKYCNRTAMGGSISIEVVGRKEIMEKAENFDNDIDELEADAEEAYYNSRGLPRLYSEEDTENAFDECEKYFAEYYGEEYDIDEYNFAEEEELENDWYKYAFAF